LDKKGQLACNVMQPPAGGRRMRNMIKGLGVGVNV
jgi:hypothetical protein